jgi:hypothetical protein
VQVGECGVELRTSAARTASSCFLEDTLAACAREGDELIDPVLFNTGVPSQ